MWVYGSNFSFDSEVGPQKIIDFVAKRAGLRANRTSVDPVLLAKSVREIRVKNGSVLSSRVTLDDSGLSAYPYFSCAQLSHGDNQVPGRRWTTEIGIRQDSVYLPIFCTVVLKTDEISAMVVPPIQVTWPKVVERLTQQCRPSSFTPGLRVRRLDGSSHEVAIGKIVGPNHKLALFPSNAKVT